MKKNKILTDIKKQREKVTLGKTSIFLTILVVLILLLTTQPENNKEENIKIDDANTTEVNTMYCEYAKECKEESRYMEINTCVNTTCCAVGNEEFKVIDKNECLDIQKIHQNYLTYLEDSIKEINEISNKNLDNIINDCNKNLRELSKTYNDNYDSLWDTCNNYLDNCYDNKTSFTEEYKYEDEQIDNTEYLQRLENTRIINLQKCLTEADDIYAQQTSKFAQYNTIGSSAYDKVVKQWEKDKENCAILYGNSYLKWK